MSDFTRFGCSIWTWDPWTALDSDGRMLYLALYTTSEAKRVVPGLWHGGISTLSEAARMPTDQVWSALDDLLEADLAEYDRKLRVIRLTKLPDAGERPMNGKHILGWWSRFVTVPKCYVRDAHVATLKWLLDQGAVTENHTEAWGRTFGDLSKVTIPAIRKKATRMAESDTSTPVQPSLFPASERERTLNRFDDSDPPISIHSGTSDTVSDTLVGSVYDTPTDTDTDRDPVSDPPGSGSGSGSEIRLAPVIVLDPSSTSRARPIGGTRDDADRDRKISAIVRAVHHEHVLAFNRVKAEINSRAFGPELMEDPRLLRELVRGMVNLDTAEERCRYALEVQEHEARAKNVMTYFGPSMWKPDNFDKALTYDLPGQLPVKARAPAISTGTNAFAAAASYFDGLRLKEKT